MSLNWTFLSKNSPSLKIHEWIQVLDAYNFLKKLAISSTNKNVKSKSSNNNDNETFDSDYEIDDENKMSVDKKKIDPQNFQYDDMFNVDKISQLLKENQSETKEKLKNYQAKCYNEELKNKKMIITIIPGHGDPNIEMTVHNIVIDMFLIERQISETERIQAKKSWIGFTEMKIPEHIKNLPNFGFKDHQYGENVIADLLQKDKVKFDAYLFYMRYIVKDPDFQIDFENQSPNEIRDLKKKQYENINAPQRFPDELKTKIKDEDDDVDMSDSFVYDPITNSHNYNIPGTEPELYGYQNDDESSDPWNNINDDLNKIETHISDNVYSGGFTEDYDIKHNISTSNNEKHPKNNLSIKNMSSFCINLQTLGVFTAIVGSQFNQRKFSSVSMRSTLFPVTVGIFPYGSISSTGSTHEVVSMLAFMHILTMLWEMYGPLSFESPVIILKNLVCSGFIGYSVSKTYLLRVYKDYFERIDEFSGIMYRDKSNKKDDKSTILIFAPQGKVCFSGGKNIESVKYHLENAVKMLRLAKDTPDTRKVSTIIETSWPRSTDELNKKYESKIVNEMDIDDDF